MPVNRQQQLAAGKQLWDFIAELIADTCGYPPVNGWPLYRG